MRIHVAMAASAVCLLSVVPALAADLPVVPPETVVASPVWTGFHVGVFGGVAGGDTSYPYDLTICDTSLLNGEVTLDSSGLFGGVNAGFDYQIGDIVLGVVGDVSMTNYEGKIGASLSVPPLGFDASAEAGSELNWLATLRGRAGFSWEDTLFYGTAGVAFGEVETGYSINASGRFRGSPVNASGSVTTDHVGFAAGGGIEHRLTQNVSVSMEYLYVDLGDEELLGEDDGRGNSYSLGVATQFHSLKGGVNFRF